MPPTVFLLLFCASASASICFNITIYKEKDGTLSIITSDKIRVQEEAYEVLVENQTLPLLNESSVEICKNLGKLTINSCGIREIKPRAFHFNDTAVLKELAITGNWISRIGSGVFNYVKVREINLYDNRIQVIEHGAFDNNQFLEGINLGMNDLRMFDPSWFAGCRNLHQLDLSKNRIEIINSDAFQDLSRNERLRLILSTNSIRKFDAPTLNHFYEIDTLDLSNNLLTDLQDDFFVNRTFGVLNLENNNFTCLPHSLAKTNVTELNLMRNIFMRCDCLRDINGWSGGNGVVTYFPSVICEDKVKEVYLVYNKNSTSVLPIPRPEFYGLQKGP